ncbi:sensor histidine kinase [Caldicellulosiruptor acetigenus]|uniref:sensor histidine kinase n=1 Tax=Caldicellulosiruptor acetigenus TaxID=301953 RepID=UPI000419306B|nr:sensor histidine kinase [Caldicellulosiruptor acetigenus]WAM36048.1 sensor histidine kinase [Caldicellulosiruptor acetigenus]
MIKNFISNLCRLLQLPFAYLTNKVSINIKLTISFILIILLSTILNLILVINFLSYSDKYNQVVTNITLANSMNKIASEKICSELWFIVAGRKNFKDGEQYKYLNLLENKIYQLKVLDPSEESTIRLDILSRTIDTFKKYIDELGIKISKKSKYEENVKLWNTICEIASLIEENIYEYKIFETNRIAQIYNETQLSFKKWFVKYTFLMLCIIFFCFINALIISQSISRPIKLLYKNTSLIAEKHLKLPKEDITNEIKGLKNNFEILINELEKLIQKSMEDHEKAKKAELKALQEQINPHFLYNTLDTIIGMIEKNDNASAIKMVKDLSQFYRISLSKGKVWVKVKEEISHIEYYLRIQKIRYSDILEYEIVIDDRILDAQILKFVLQPIVENAIYHGIKPKRQKGKITIKGMLVDNTMLFEITDNGVGIPPDKLNSLKNILYNGDENNNFQEISFGLLNVHQRIKIYYGKDYGLEIESSPLVGTTVKLKVPFFKTNNS